MSKNRELLNAVITGDLYTVKYLISTNSIDFPFQVSSTYLKEQNIAGPPVIYDDTLIRIAAEYNQLEIVKYLIIALGKTHYHDGRPYSYYNWLECAARKGSIDVVKFFVEQNHNIYLGRIYNYGAEDIVKHFKMVKYFNQFNVESHVHGFIAAICQKRLKVTKYFMKNTKGHIMYINQGVIFSLLATSYSFAKHFQKEIECYSTFNLFHTEIEKYKYPEMKKNYIRLGGNIFRYWSTDGPGSFTASIFNFDITRYPRQNKILFRKGLMRKQKIK